MKFKDGMGPPSGADSVTRARGGTHISGPWRGVRFSRVFVSLPPAEIEELVRSAEIATPGYVAPDFLAWYFADPPAGTDLDGLVHALRASQLVASAYVSRPAAVPPGGGVPDRGDADADGTYVFGIPSWPRLRYLDPAPVGIDAHFAWLFDGGTGALQTFADVEQGWQLDHPDLPGEPTVQLLRAAGADPEHQQFQAHGAAVLGIVCGVPNGIDGVGIAFDLVRAWAVLPATDHGATDPNYADAIFLAASRLHRGDVLLIEAQCPVDDGMSDGVGVFAPIEVRPEVYHALEYAGGRGIVVVEPGGNGASNPDLSTPRSQRDEHSIDFNTFTQDGLRVLDRRVRDSGAILVSAANSPLPHDPRGSAPVGERVDCFAWGDSIATCSYDETLHGGFKATSASAAIVAGAAIVLQGVARRAFGMNLAASEVRRLLSDRTPGGNTPSSVGTAREARDRIGVMPNLRWLIRDVLPTLPCFDVRQTAYDLRNTRRVHFGPGDPSAAKGRRRQRSAAGPDPGSPDIILRRAPARNPKSAFGEGSGTEDDAHLSETARAGRDHHIYLRVRNHGGSAGAFGADVYCAPAATVLSTSTWKRIGRTRATKVPAKGVLTVCPAIRWKKSDVPPPGEYVLVAIPHGSAAPDDASRQLDTQVRLVREVLCGRAAVVRTIEVV